MASAHQSEICLIGSIGQDICRAATRGQWKLPKHIFLCMTLHHLFRSKELTTLMNRFGHCESFSLEVETAIAKALKETSSLLSSQIVCNPTVPYVFHSDFDNFDQFVNDLSGTGSVHTANGIMLQDLEEVDSPSNAGGELPDIPSVERTKQRCLDLDFVSELPVCCVTNRKSPNFMIARRVDFYKSIWLSSS